MLVPFSRLTSPLQEVLYAAFSRVQEDTQRVLAVWLRHVAYNLTQSPGDARNWIWTSRNVDSVLRAL